MEITKVKSTGQAFIVSVLFHLIVLVILGVYLYQRSYEERATKGLQAELIRMNKPRARRVVQIRQVSPAVNAPRTVTPTPKPMVNNRIRNITTAVNITGPDEGFGLAPETGGVISDGFVGLNRTGPMIRPDVATTRISNKPKLLEFVDTLGEKRRIVYCIDVSASMSAGFNKLGMAKTYLRESISDLSRDDSFNIIAFHSQTISLSPDMLDKTLENVNNALRFLDRFTDETTAEYDRTDLFAPLALAVRMNPDLIVLVTDGLPSAGILNPMELARKFKSINSGNIKLYAIGMGLTANSPGAFMLSRLATENDGDFELIQR